MNDNTGQPAAERWRALAEDSHSVAEGMTDPEAKLTMRQIALGYDRMAIHAEQREAAPIEALITADAEPGTA